MALFLHAGLHVIGPSGYGSLLEESIRLANVMADKLEQHERFQLLMRPETNIVLYRYVPIKFNAAAKNGTLTEEQNAEINRLNVAIQKVQTDGGHTYVIAHDRRISETAQLSNCGTPSSHFSIHSRPNGTLTSFSETNSRSLSV